MQTTPPVTSIQPEQQRVTALSDIAPTVSAPVRVLLMTNSVAIGGMEKHVELIARELDRSQVEVFALCPEWAPIDAWAATLAQTADHCVRLSPDRRYGLINQMKDAVRMWRWIKQQHIQVMHMHLTTYAGGLWALLAARMAGVRVVLCTEHLTPDRPVAFMKRLTRNLVTRTFDQVVCVSLKNRQAREQYIFTPVDKTTVVTNGIDVAPFEPTPAGELEELRTRLGIPAGAPVVGTVVRFEDEKGLNYLLDAMPNVLETVPDAYLLMVGDGSLRMPLEQQADSLGIRDRVVFAGFQADPRPYLSLMNAFVLPVPFGSASIGLLEAMAMRRAVVITFGGEGEPVVDGDTGLCRPPRDPAALAEAIQTILLHPALERELGEQARRRVETDFSSQAVASHLLTLYCSLYQERVTRFKRTRRA